MTKAVSLQTTSPKSSDAALSPSAPPSKPSDDAGAAGSFASLLDTAAPSNSDEREKDDQSDRTKIPTDREQPQHHDEGTTYFTHADLALAWLASRDVTLRSPKEWGEAGETRGTIDSSVSSGPSESASAALNGDVPETGTPVSTAEPASDIAEDGQTSLAPLPAGTPLGTAATANAPSAGASIPSSATSSEHRADEPAPLKVSSASATNEGNSSLLWSVGGITPAKASNRRQSTPTESAASLATEQRATNAGDKAAGQASSDSVRTSVTRDRDGVLFAADRGGEARTTAQASTSALSATPPTAPSPPGEVAGRPSGSSEAKGAGQTTSDAFVTTNTELSAAITKAQRGPDGSYHVTALLNPPSLGRVDVAIKVNGESVEVAITPHTAEGHDALAHHLDELQRELAGEHSEVHLSLADSGNHPRHGNVPGHEPISAAASDEEDAGPETHAPAPDSSLHIIL